MKFQFIASAALALAFLTGCHASHSTAAPAGANTASPNTASANTAGVTVYHMRGKVVSVDAAQGVLMVDSENIPGFMDAMTMPYTLKDPSVAAKLHPGDEITADVLVSKTAEDTVQLDHIVVVAQTKPK